MRSLEGEHYEEYKLTKEKERLAKLAQVRNFVTAVLSKVSYSQ